MDITPVDPESLEQLRAFQDVTDAVFAADVPDLPPSPFEELVAAARTPQTSVRESRWLLHDEGAAVGVARASFFLRDNTDQCARDGRGAPGAPAARLRPRAVRLPRRAGEARGPRCGCSPRSRNRSSTATPRQDLPSRPGWGRPGHWTRSVACWTSTHLDEARLDALEAEARSRSAGYETVSWIGPTPDDLVDDYAQLMAQMSVDAPMGELDWEPEAWDAGRVREQER